MSITNAFLRKTIAKLLVDSRSYSLHPNSATNNTCAGRRYLVDIGDKNQYYKAQTKILAANSHFASPHTSQTMKIPIAPGIYHSNSAMQETSLNAKLLLARSLLSLTTLHLTPA
ncbi:MAG TPA: hypothetical protein VN030_04715 [Cellvibrio sp.]|nr:hypothetical protein [Cellvibrio sp.]